MMCISTCCDIHLLLDVLNLGMPAAVLSKILGHANVATTLNVYCAVFDKFKKEHLDMSFEYLKKQGLTIEF